MKFYEHGVPGRKSILLLPGNMMTHRQFEHLVPLLAERYHVISVSFDGFDETGKTTYTTAEQQAQQLASFLHHKLNGRIDLVLSQSLGGAPAAFLTRCEGISIGGLIMDGASYWNLGILNSFAKSTLYRIPYGILTKARKQGRLVMPGWLLKSMGLTQEGIDSLTHQMALDVSAETLKATFAEGIDLYVHMRRWAPKPELPVACWHGETESNMKPAVQVLRQAFPSLEVRAFPGMGHGEFLTHEEAFAAEMEDFMVRNQI